MNAEALLADLNPPQREAVLHAAGPVLVLAGAGSGKTRVITYRIAHLLSQGVRPVNILAVTFTNKAAKEMRDRIVNLAGDTVRGAWIGTFHATCARMLRIDGSRIGVPPEFVILDDRDQQSIVRQEMQSAQMDPTAFKPRQVLTSISRAKESFVTPEAMLAAASTLEENLTARVYRGYETRLREMAALDFDDLLLRGLELLQQDEETRERYRHRFQQILVDEYQDINQPQYQFIRLLAQPRENLCVVGDDDQSVYGWRGARVEFILEFAKAFSSARVIKLEQNYRSTQVILNVAHGVVRRLPGRHEKELWTENDAGDPIVVISAPDDTTEARLVINAICVEVTAGRAQYGDFAILYRTNAQSRLIEDSARLARIPYRIAAGNRFYDRKEVRDLLAYLRLVHNPKDSISLQRVINEPARGIGAKTVERIEEFAAAQGMTALEAARRAAEIEELKPRTRAAVDEFVAVIDDAAALGGRGGAAPVLEQVVARSGYREALRLDGSAEATDREAIVDEFIRVAREYDAESSDGLAGFLEQMALISDVDTLGAGADSVTLMTVHAAKGLEFPQVVICGMEEGIFPHARAIYDANAASLSEERRLCYVAFTRARQRLILSHAFERIVMGSKRAQTASRFLSELPHEHVEFVNARRSGGEFRPGRTSSSGPIRTGSAPPSPASSGSVAPGRLPPRPASAPRPGELYKPGDLVMHDVFGSGVVTKSLMSGSDEEVQIVFPKHGMKKLIAAASPMRKA